MKEKEEIKIKNYKMFKSKTQMVIYTILFIIFIVLFILIGKNDYNKSKNDAIKFNKDFPSIEKDNVFKYINAVKAGDIVKNGKGIILFGHKNNEWVEYYVKLVNDVAKEVGIKKIYYYDVLDDRKNNNATYEDMINKLENYVYTNDVGKKEIYTPTLLVMNKGKVLLFDNDTNFIKGTITPDIYYNDYNYGEKYNELKTVFNEYLKG